MQVRTDSGAEPAMEHDDTDPRLSAAERKLLEEARLRGVATGKLQCPVCQENYTPGELTCPRCGTVLDTGGQTIQLETLLEKPAKKPPVGDAFASDQKPIVFEIDGTELELPPASVVVVGRTSNVPGDPQPDVDLSAFNAEKMGVSRQHVKILRRHDLTYVSDMGSINGTFLNGHQLSAGIQRIIRDGDELKLGYLRITVRF